MKNLYYSINRFKGLIIGLIMVVLACYSTGTFAQAGSVNITVNIIPPYSPYYSDYSGPNASKVLLIITNTTTVSKTIKLTGQLEGDNGIKISTKSTYVPLQPIVLGPNETKQLNGLALKDIFDLNSLNVYGIDKSRLIYTSRLPEGNYNFCIQALDLNTNQILSSTAPLGCTSITIAYPEAPVPINPAANFNSTATYPQSLIFNWINPGYAPPGTQYILQVAEMPMIPADPNQILNSVSFPLLNKTVTGFSYVLNPSDPPLKLGKRYAWRVKAVDPTGKTVFKNDGVSQAYQFRYGNAIAVPSVFTLDKPQNNQGYADLNNLVFNWTFKDNSAKNDPVSLNDLVAVKTTYNQNYTYELHINRYQDIAEKNAIGSAMSKAAVKEGMIIPTNNQSISFKDQAALAAYLKDQNTYEWYVIHTATGTKSEVRKFVVKYEKQDPPYTLTMRGGIKYEFFKNYDAVKSAGKAFAFQNFQILRVNVTVPLKTVIYSDTLKENGIPKIYKDTVEAPDVVSNLRNFSTKPVNLNQSVLLASGQTDSIGNFVVNVPITPNQYKITDKFTINGKRFGVTEVLVVHVNDSRFSDPNWLIYPKSAQKTVVLENEVIQAYDYNIKVQLSTNFQRDYKGKLYLLKNPDQGIAGESDNIVGQDKLIEKYKTNKITGYTKYFTNYTVVGVKNVDAKSGIGSTFNYTFDNARLATGSTDNYTVFFEPDQSQDALYFSPVAVYQTNTSKQKYSSTAFAKTKLLTQEVSFGPKFLTMKISGIYKYKWKDPAGKTNGLVPLPKGTVLRLYKAYLTSSFVEDGTLLDSKLVVASTLVGDGGQYSFDLGMLDYENFNKEGKSLVIVVDNAYYYSDPKQIIYNQNENVKMEDLVAEVKQYRIQSRIVDENTDKGREGLNVYLCRAINIDNLQSLPRDEGDPDKEGYIKKIYTDIKGRQYQILDKTVSLSGGVFNFNRMVMYSKTVGDGYFIAAEPKTGSPDNYITPEPFAITGAQVAFSFLTVLAKEYRWIFKDQASVSTKIWDNIPNKFYVPVSPQLPYIEGAIYPYSNTSTQPLAGVTVELFNMKDVATSTATTDAQKILSFLKIPVLPAQITGPTGRFEFKGFNYGAGSGWYMMRFTKKGFITTYKNINSGAEFYKGQRQDLGKAFMELPKTLIAKVVGSNGEPVKARIVVGDDFSWADTKTFVIYSDLNGNQKTKETVTLSSPKGLVDFTIIPLDKATYKTTVISKNITSLNYDLGELIVQSKQHVVNVTCVDANTNKTINADVQITNLPSNVKVNQQKFNWFGLLSTAVSFSSAGSQFDVRVIPTGNFTIAKTQIKSDMTGTVFVTVYVYQATTLTLSAYTMSPNKIGVIGFDAYIKGYDDDQVVKSSSGKFVTFSKVPTYKYIKIGLTASGYLGIESGIDIKGIPLSKSFELVKEPVGFPKTLSGFPIQITKFESTGVYTTRISGRLDATGKSSQSGIQIDPAGSKWLEFKDLIVKTEVDKFDKTKKYLVPTSKLIFEENELDAMVYNVYKAKIMNKSGLSLEGNTTGGSIGGKVGVDPSSLAPGLKISAENGSGNEGYMYLNERNVAYNKVLMGIPKSVQTLNTITNNNSSEVSKTEMLASSSGLFLPSFVAAGNLQIKPAEDLVFRPTGMVFKGTVQTNLAHVKNKNINASATFTVSNKGFTSSAEEVVVVDLNKWQLNFKKWKLNQNGFMVNNGLLNALGLTIPFDALSVTKDELGFGNFNVSELKILNAFPIKMNSADVMSSFGYDSGFSKDGGAWSVSMLSKSSSASLGGLKGLPDVNPFDEIQIQNISLYDTGSDEDTRIIIKDDQKAVGLNGFAKFTPTTVWGGVDFVNFRGKLDLSVPNLNGLDLVTYDLKYQNNNGLLKHVKSEPFKNLYLDVNGVKVTFNNDTTSQEFTNNVLKLKGTLKDKDVSAPYKIDVVLEKGYGYANVSIKDAAQKIYLSGVNGSYLAKPSGSMSLTGSSWDNFTFSGLMTVPNGISSNESLMNFTIKGDVVANDQKVGVQNMSAGKDTGISGINFAYDFQQKALVGSAHIDKETPKFQVIGDIELLIGGDKWYVFSNSIVKKIQNSPITEAGATFLVGDADITPTQLDGMHKHFIDNMIPKGFDDQMQKITGVAVVYSAQLPLPLVPTWDLNLKPVLKSTLKHGIFANAYQKFDFSLDPTNISFFTGVRLGAFIKLSAGASIGLACAGVSLSATAFADLNFKLTPLNPKFIMKGSLNFIFEGEAYVGVGICDSDCDTPCWSTFLGKICSPIPCIKHGMKGKLVLDIGATVDNSGIKLDNPVETSGSSY